MLKNMDGTYYEILLHSTTDNIILYDSTDSTDQIKTSSLFVVYIAGRFTYIIYYGPT